MFYVAYIRLNRENLVKKLTYLLLLIVMLLGITLAFTQSGDNSEERKVRATVSERSEVKNKANEQSKKQPKPYKQEVIDSQENLNGKTEGKEVEVSRTKQILEQVVPEGEAARRVDSTERGFLNSNQTAQSVQFETEIYNSIYEKGIYDNLKQQDLIFNKVECRKAGCKLEFNFEDDSDEKALSKKRLIIFAELRKLEKLKDKQAVSNTDNNTIHYYYY